MPRGLYKPNPDLDEYIIWSTIVDAPVSSVMTREEAVAAYQGGEESAARADETGTSWRDWRTVQWGETKLIREINAGGEYFEGMCQFTDLAKITRAYEAGDAETLRALIEPFDYADDGDTE